MNSFSKNITPYLSRYTSILLLWAVLICLSFSACQQDYTFAQLEVNDVCIEEYEFDCITLGLEGCKLVVQCEEEQSPLSKQTTAKKKRKKKRGDFDIHVHFFLQLMKSGEIAEAAQYSTQYGLKTFLNFDIDKIEKFTIRQIKSDEVLGTAMVKINHLPEKLFYFNKRNNRWTFVGTDDWRG